MSLEFTNLSDVPAITEIADGDYILTVKNGEVKKILKSDAQFGGGGKVWFTLSGGNICTGVEWDEEKIVPSTDAIEAFDGGSVGIYYPYIGAYGDMVGYRPYSDDYNYIFFTSATITYGKIVYND